jgi:hypothetical protein
VFDQSGSLTVEFFIRFLVSNAFLLVLLRLVHYRATLRRDSLGGFLLFGNGIFLVTSLLQNVQVSMGLTLGLFAIFGMLRYRTEALTTVEMAYLFVSIAISLMSAVGKLNIGALLVVNSMLCGLAVFCESSLLAAKKLEKNIVYERVDLVHPSRREELRHDLQQRTGLVIDRIEVGDIDFLRDTTMLKVFYTNGDNRTRKETAGQTAEQAAAWAAGAGLAGAKLDQAVLRDWPVESPDEAYAGATGARESRSV